MTTTSSDLKYQYAFDRFIAYLEKLQQERPVMQRSIQKVCAALPEAYCKGLSIVSSGPAEKKEWPEGGRFCRRMQVLCRTAGPRGRFRSIPALQHAAGQTNRSLLAEPGVVPPLQKLYRRPIY